jgi:hypothetical protein
MLVSDYKKKGPDRLEYIPLAKELPSLEIFYKNSGGHSDATSECANGIRFPSDEILCEAASSCGLDPLRKIVILLKNRWEAHLAHTMCYDAARDPDFTLFLAGLEPGEEELSSFKPDIPAMIRTLRICDEQQFGDQSAREGKGPAVVCDEGELGVLAKEMLLNRIYLHGLSSAPVSAFIEKKETESRALAEAGDEVSREFWISKCVWIELSEELADLLLALESSRIRNGYIVKTFLLAFGEAYVRMKEEVTRLVDLERRIMLKEANPGWTGPEIDAKVAELELGESDRLKELETDRLLAASIDEVSSGNSISEEAVSDYKARAKKMLREIFFLLHPHRLSHHPSYEKLTVEQREHLATLWGKTMEIKQTDLKYPEGTVGRSIHSLDKLTGIRDTARKILEHSGLDVNVDYIISGATAMDRIDWLAKEITQLENDIADVKCEIIALANDEDVLEKKAIVGCPEKHAEVKNEMIARTEAIRKEADELESKLALLFGNGM